MDEVKPIQWLPKGNESFSSASHCGIYTYLFKVASRCNLSCDYCYVYNGPDQSWSVRPKFMSLEVLEQASLKINRHATSRRLETISVVFHGGEPLLAGHERFSQYLERLKSIIDCNIEFAVQTNGTLLDVQFLELFSKFNVRIGISLDGNREANDRHRRFRNGRGSYDRVMHSLNLISRRHEWKRLLGGFLSVVDLQNSPHGIFSELKRIGAKSFDLLLPDSHHDAPPLRPADDVEKIAFGKWYADFFDIWLENDHDMEIRYFEEIIAMLFGQESSMEAIGAKNVDLIVIESDGDIEAVDTLKVVSKQATSLGLNVRTHEIDDVYLKPGIYSRLIGYDALCRKCRSCEYVDCCGGGYLPHRYGRGAGFMNESVYCTDIIHLIRHIRRRLNSEIVAQ